MLAKDLYHETVKVALTKEGWRITQDPLILQLGKRSIYIDVGAGKLIAAERGAEKIAVEIKSFVSPSPIRDLEQAWGQFFMYARTLQRQEPDRLLYLAVTLATCEALFNEQAGQLLLAEPDFRLIVFDPKKQEIVRWIV